MSAMEWRDYTARIEQLARQSGLRFHPVEFEAVPDSFMMEVAVYPFFSQRWVISGQNCHGLASAP